MPEAAVAPTPPPAPAPSSPPSPAPAAPAQTARQRLASALESKIKPEGSPAPAPAPKPAAAAPAPPEPQKPGEPKAGEVTPAEPTEPEGKPGKVSPWKLVDQFKSKLAAVEAENLELKGKIVPESDIKSLRERLEAADKRIADYENEIRHVSYTKSDEFKTKYQQPYEAAWRRAMKELSGIQVGDEGEKHAMNSNDLLALVNMDLGPARELANAAFGDFADDVMRYRNELRGLADQQMEAIEEARTKGAEREKATNEERARANAALASEISKTWKEVNEVIQNDPELGKFFQKRDGDEEWNKRIENGYAFVDKAWNENPLNPKLTPQERREVIKRHTAIRHRAASWGALRSAYGKVMAELEAVKKELAGFKSSEPGRGNGVPSSAPPVGSAKDRVLGAFIAKAK